MAVRSWAAAIYLFSVLGATISEEIPFPGWDMTGWEAGGICKDIPPGTLAKDFLRGKHLVVYELPWKPYGIIDKTTKSGWRGFNIDLLDEIVDILGFNYTIYPFDILKTEDDWSQVLYRVADNSDLVTSYWFRNPDRLNRVLMMGHLDTSSVLIAREEHINSSGGLMGRMVAFFRPYTLGLWLCILGMILISGVVDYILEKETAPGLGSSIYEYLSGTLWGGFQYPRTLASAIYQIVIAFLMLITISSYTANLTTFLTVSVKPRLTCSSMGEVMTSRDLTLCSFRHYLDLTAVEILYPQAQVKIVPLESDLLAMLANGSCDAGLAPRMDYTRMRQDEQGCSLWVVQTLFPRQASWVTNPKSPCVQRAFEYALAELLSDGKHDKIWTSWMKPAECTNILKAKLGESKCEDTARRLSFEDEDQDFSTMNPDFSAMNPVDHTDIQSQKLDSKFQKFSGLLGSFAASILPDSRRLAAKKSETSGEGQDQEIGVMTIMDFCGVFSLWGCITFLVLLVSRFERMCKGCVSCCNSELHPAHEETGGNGNSQKKQKETATALQNLGNRSSQRANMRLSTMGINIYDQPTVSMKILLEIMHMKERQDEMMELVAEGRRSPVNSIVVENDGAEDDPTEKHADQSFFQKLSI